LGLLVGPAEILASLVRPEGGVDTCRVWGESRLGGGLLHIRQGCLEVVGVEHVRVGGATLTARAALLALGAITSALLGSPVARGR